MDARNPDHLEEESPQYQNGPSVRDRGSGNRGGRGRGYSNRGRSSNHQGHYNNNDSRRNQNDNHYNRDNRGNSSYGGDGGNNRNYGGNSQDNRNYNNNQYNRSNQARNSEDDWNWRDRRSQDDQRSSSSNRNDNRPGNNYSRQGYGGGGRNSGRGHCSGGRWEEDNQYRNDPPARHNNNWSRGDRGRGYNNSGRNPSRGGGYNNHNNGPSQKDNYNRDDRANNSTGGGGGYNDRNRSNQGGRYNNYDNRQYSNQSYNSSQNYNHGSPTGNCNDNRPDNYNSSVAILVPYRDLHPAQKRAAHLQQFVPHMIQTLNQQQQVTDFHIYIVEQSNDHRKFNRGKLLNIGFEIASRKDHDVFVFHDVDLLPDSVLAPWYAKFPRTPIHIARVWNRYSNNPKYFGGAVSFSRADYQKINGFPNNFWGWGGEDDELQLRCEAMKIRWVAPTSGSMGDLEDLNLNQKLALLKQNQDWKNMIKYELRDEHAHTWRTNGLSDLKYTVLEQTPLDKEGKATKMTVDVGLNGNHWSNEKCGFGGPPSGNWNDNRRDNYNDGQGFGGRGHNRGGRYGGRGGRGRGRGRGRGKPRNQEPWEPRGPGEFRGIFGPKGDSQEWLDATQNFPNGVPRFETKEECLEFMKDFVSSHGGSNPDFPHLQHIFTTLITWDQIETILLPAMEQARQEPSSALPVPSSYGLEADDSSNNIYEQSAAQKVVDAINFRLDQPLHQSQTAESVMNTLQYSFHHMKRGIYVMIRNGQLRIFCPFSNRDYTNSWSEALKLEGGRSVQEYYDQKGRMWRPEILGQDIEPDMTKWWANGNIICNTPCQGDHLHPSQLQQWGDHFLSPIRDALAQACRERQIPDCEFFLNKRDYPQIKINVERGGVLVEPYGFIFDKDDRDPQQDVDIVPEHCYQTMAPMVSFYAAAENRFTDIPFPSSEDWEGACGKVFPQTFIAYEKGPEGRPDFQAPRDLFTETNFCKFQRGWEEDRVATAFFRGSATGGGTTIETNQRLNLAHLSHEWKNDPEKGGPEPFLNAAITGWNSRDKKTAQSPLTYVRRKDFDFQAGKKHYTPIYEQSQYKYLVYVDGHCAACRYGFMMRLGCVILKVESQQVADRMWYFPLLEPWVDHVPVKADLSDLEEQIRWCRANDDKCQEIAANSVQLYHQYVAEKPLLDYVEMVTKHIAKRQASIASPHA